MIERNYQDIKSELGLSHYEGRNWRGFHHHATLCIAAYGFLMLQRLRGRKPSTPGACHNPKASDRAGLLGSHRCRVQLGKSKGDGVLVVESSPGRKRPDTVKEARAKYLRLAAPAAGLTAPYFPVGRVTSAPRNSDSTDPTTVYKERLWTSASLLTVDHLRRTNRRVRVPGAAVPKLLR